MAIPQDRGTGPNDFRAPKNKVDPKAITNTYGGRKDPAPWAKGPNDGEGNNSLGVYAPGEFPVKTVNKTAPGTGS